MGRTLDELQASLSTDLQDRLIDDLHPKSLDEMEEHPHEEDDAAHYQRVVVDLANANARGVTLDLLRKRRAQVRIQTAQWLGALGRLTHSRANGRQSRGRAAAHGGRKLDADAVVLVADPVQPPGAVASRTWWGPPAATITGRDAIALAIKYR